MSLTQEEIFFCVDPNMLGDDGYYIGKDIFTPEELKKVQRKWVESVVKNKEDWEVFYSEVEDPTPKGIRNKKNGHQLFICPFGDNLMLGHLVGWDNCKFLVRELGDSVENRKKFGDYVKSKHEERKEFVRLCSLISGSQDLKTLEKNYQIVKNSPLYAADKKVYDDNDFENNKIYLDELFNDWKKYLWFLPMTHKSLNN